MIYQPRDTILEVVTPPATLPITLDEVKTQLNIIDNTDDDADINDAIAAAVSFMEGALNRAIITQQRSLRLPAFPVSKLYSIELPGGTVSAISSVTYVDSDGANQTLAADQYEIQTGVRGPSSLNLVTAADAWPEVDSDTLWPVLVTYSTGWADAASVPADLRRGLKMLAATLFTETEAVVPVGMTESIWFKALVAQWRLRKVL